MLTTYNVCQKNHHHGQLIGGAAKYAAVYTPTFVKDCQGSCERHQRSFGNKGIPTTSQSSSTSIRLCKNLGSQAHVFAQGCLELDADVNAAYGLHLDLGLCGQEGPASAPAVGLSQHDGIRNAARLESIEPGTSSQPGTSSKAVMPLMDVEAPEEGEEVEDMVAEARRQMRHVGEQPGVARPLSRLEGFQRSDDGEFSLAPNLRREVHRVHRNLGHPGNEVFVRALQNAGVRDHIIEWTKKAFQMPHMRC